MISYLVSSFKSTFAYTGLVSDDVDKKNTDFWDRWRRGEWTAITVTYWVGFTMYIFALPWLSDSLNQKYWWNPPNQAGLGPLCHTSVFAPGLECKNGQDLVDIALRHNRTWICGCGQGLFGESLCPVVPGGFSVSFFVGSSMGTGLFTFLSFWPMLSLWWYQDWLQRTHQNPPEKLLRYSWSALCGVQVFYGLLCCTQVCFFPRCHAVCWILFLICWFTHISLISWICRSDPALQKVTHVIATNVLIVFFANIGMFLSTQIDCFLSMHVCSYGYWFFECIQLSAISGMSCFLVVLANMEVPLY